MLGMDRKAARYTWTVVAVLLLVDLIYTVRSTLFVFTIALLFAYLLYPLVNLLDRAMQAVAEARVPCLDQPERGRHDAFEECRRLRSRRSVGSIAADGDPPARRNDVCGGILQKGCIERGRLLEAQRRAEARLRASGN